MALALPPCGLHWLAWIALTPALVAARGGGFWRAFAIGIAVLGVAALVSRSGIPYRPSLLDGESGWVFAGFGLFGLAVGLTFGVWGCERTTSVRQLFLLAAASVCFEALLLLYLPGHLALTQARVPTMLALASVTGIWGVSYLIWLSNLAVAWAWQTRNLRRLLVPVVLLVVAIALGPLFWKPEPGDLRVAAIQTEAHDVTTLARLNAEAGQRGALLAVWPEGSANALAPHGDTAALRSLARRPGQPAFVPGFLDDFSPLPHNCVSQITPDGESARYAKRRPFGSERSAHTPGDHAVAVPWNGHRLGFGICFDSCYPETLREAGQLGVDLIALPTEDPRAPYGTVQSLHASYTAFRAAETGVPIIRADVSAYSQILDGHGLVLAEGRSGTEEVVIAAVRPTHHWTLYAYAGDWFLYLCIAIVILGLIAKPNKARTNNESRITNHE